MAYTLSYAILGSMILALTAIPVLMTVIYKKHFTSQNPGNIEWHNPVYYWIEKKYMGAIEFFTKHALPVVVTSFAVVIVIAFFGARQIGTEFLPELDEGAFNIRCFFPVGITLQDAAVYCPVIRNVISNHKQVNVVLTQLGRNDDGTDPIRPKPA